MTIDCQSFYTARIGRKFAFKPSRLTRIATVAYVVKSFLSFLTHISQQPGFMRLRV